MIANKIKKYLIDVIFKICEFFKVDKNPRGWHTVITIISYLSLLILLTEANTVSIIRTLVVFLLGLFFILLKNPKKIFKLSFDHSLTVSLGLVTYFGYCFYMKWLPSSKIKAVASIFGVPDRVFVVLCTICFSLCSGYFVFFILKQMKNAISASCENKPYKRDIMCSLLMASATVFIAQIMSDAKLFSMGLVKFAVGTLIVIGIIVFFYCIFGRIIISIILGSFPFLIISTINVYVYSFRDRMFEPLDIFTVGTAMNVADNYSLLPIPIKIIFGWAGWLAVIFYIFSVCGKSKEKLQWKKRVVLFALCAWGLFSIFCYTLNLKTYHWDNEGAVYNGYILDFMSKIKESYVAKPDGYSTDTVDNLADTYLINSTEPDTDGDKPHIIVIMDEAFSDLGVIGNIKTNTDVMPFISSLKENTTYGYALSSVFGGNTANSEFEFLTGNSMAWLSPNAVPYQQYIKSSAYSMVSYLKSSYGYNCIAMHPYLSDGWNRVNAYTYLGFDSYLFLEDFPQENCIRKYVSDQEMFEKIVEIYENQDENDGSLFLFGVSMQNHGGYSYEGDNYVETVSLSEYDDYPEVNQYLSLLSETDKAVEYLISYFSEVDEDVVIVFFGDHQPKFSDDFYEEITGTDLDSGSLNDRQQKYKVSFFIWTNYDSDEKHVECTSLNYLSSHMYESAGLTMPPYNNFLLELEREIPSINANGFYSLENQCFMSFESATEEERKWLSMYELLQYNNLFDSKNRNDKLFPITTQKID